MTAATPSRSGASETPEPGDELALPAKHTFTVVEVAQIIGVNHKTLRESMNAGRIRHIRLGRVIRIPRSEVLRLLGE